MSDFIDEPFPSNSKHTFEIRYLVHDDIAFTTHLSNLSLLSRTVRAKRSDPVFVSTFSQSFEVYKKYQTTIHKDDEDSCDMSQFNRFLCDSSLVAEEEEVNVSEDLVNGYGAFHQQYVIDGKIVAVGVIDVLRDCISSVYLYYDPEYRFLSLGSLSALFEIGFTLKLSALWPSLQYYYMGFYIHTCAKMRYKAQFSASYLLCPEILTWVSMDECKPQLDRNKYTRLCHDPNAAPQSDPVDLDEVLVLYDQDVMTFKDYLKWRSESDLSTVSKKNRDSFLLKENQEVSTYARSTGLSLAKKMLLFRP